MKKYKLQLLADEFRRAGGDQQYAKGLAAAAILLLNEADRDWVIKRFKRAGECQARLRAVEAYGSTGGIPETVKPIELPGAVALGTGHCGKKDGCHCKEEVREETETVEAVEEADNGEALTEAEDGETEAEPDEGDASKEEPNPRKRKRGEKGGKPVDLGKIRALRNAGWDVPKIADEMGYTTSYIYKLLRGMGL